MRETDAYWLNMKQRCVKGDINEILDYSLVANIKDRNTEVMNQRNKTS